MKKSDVVPIFFETLNDHFVTLLPPILLTFPCPKNMPYSCDTMTPHPDFIGRQVLEPRVNYVTVI